ncbi:hypothetical protein BCR44DRAFT_63693 [Catenaria anguillulae PL171]|uniref:GRIP domain-containing protein n=1 Tax=Catenaria anguillulae PL171 TaxID=765915 RepID=A0A1Y2I2J9_9FUNG|nr:hypothetical protein BCR44DRAFT_63693 [Catenaria anguillulae PL171]
MADAHISASDGPSSPTPSPSLPPPVITATTNGKGPAALYPASPTSAYHQHHSLPSPGFPSACALPPLPLSPTHPPTSPTQVQQQPSALSLSLPVSPSSAAPLPAIPASPSSTAALQSQIAQLQAQIQQQTLAFEEFKQASAQRAAQQLEDRMIKVVALLIRFVSNPSEQVPVKTPHFIRNAIDSLRAVRDGAVAGVVIERDRLAQENTQLHQDREQLSSEISHLRDQLDLATDQLAQLPTLKSTLSKSTSDLASATSDLTQLRSHLAATESRLTTATGDLHQATKRIKDLESQLATARTLCDAARDSQARAQDECAHWQREAERMAEEAAMVQVALEDAQAAARADADMRNGQWQRRVDAMREVSEAAHRELEKKRERVVELEEIVADKAKMVRELQAEVHSLTHHIQHKLNDIASEKDVDRALVANLVIQFVTQPPVRRWEILTPLAAMLNFTPEQRVAVGLDKPGQHPQLASAGASVEAPPDPLAANRRASLVSATSPVTADPRSPASPSAAGSQKFEQSLSEKFISFLLREATVTDVGAASASGDKGRQ